MGGDRVQLVRTDLPIPSDPGIDLFVHGGGPGGLASFDLPMADYSVAEDLAIAGHDV